MTTLKLILRAIPWLVVLLLLGWVYFNHSTAEEKTTVVHHNTILQKMEALGRLELVKYNFKEITELKKLSKEYFNFFKLGPDAKIALISGGEAVGCIDLQKLNFQNIHSSEDSVFITLPYPEICYYKLNLENTRIYSLETNPFTDEAEFIEQAFKAAEKEIERAALNSGILEQTMVNGVLFLQPLLEELSGKPVKVAFQQKPEKVKIEKTNQVL